MQLKMMKLYSNILVCLPSGSSRAESWLVGDGMVINVDNQLSRIKHNLRDKPFGVSARYCLRYIGYLNTTLRDYVGKVTRDGKICLNCAFHHSIGWSPSKLKVSIHYTLLNDSGYKREKSLLSYHHVFLVMFKCITSNCQPKSTSSPLYFFYIEFYHNKR